MAVAVEQGNSILIQNETAATYGPFSLLGGTYAVWQIQSSTGSVTVNTIGPDGSTVKPIVTALVAANSSWTSPVYLAAGQYNVVVTGAATAWVSVSPINTSIRA